MIFPAGGLFCSAPKHLVSFSYYLINCFSEAPLCALLIMLKYT